MTAADGSERVVYPGLRERVSLVTGGANGIGARLVVRLVEQQARVAFVDVDETAAGRLVHRLGRVGSPPLFLHCDLTEISALRSAVAEVVRRLGPVRVLMNNAASDVRQPFASVEPSDWDRAMAVNLRHQFFAAQAVAEGMAAAGGGSIVNFGSITWSRPAADLAVYATAKAAVLGMTRSLARELGPRNIRVNAITPGWTMTERQKALAMREQLDEALAHRCLVTHIDPDAVAAVALFLASSESRMCTAQNFVVDAGSL